MSFVRIGTMVHLVPDARTGGRCRPAVVTGIVGDVPWAGGVTIAVDLLVFGKQNTYPQLAVPYSPEGEPETFHLMEMCEKR